MLSRRVSSSAMGEMRFAPHKASDQDAGQGPRLLSPAQKWTHFAGWLISSCVSSGTAEQIADSGVVTAAHRELLSVDEMDHKVTAGLCADLFDKAQVHNGGAMNAQENLRIQTLLH